VGALVLLVGIGVLFVRLAITRSWVLLPSLTHQGVVRVILIVLIGLAPLVWWFFVIPAFCLEWWRRRQGDIKEEVKVAPQQRMTTASPPAVDMESRWDAPQSDLSSPPRLIQTSPPPQKCIHRKRVHRSYYPVYVGEQVGAGAVVLGITPSPLQQSKGVNARILSEGSDPRELYHSL
jgi:hypothetical protein